MQRSNLIIVALIAFIVIYVVVIQNIQPIPSSEPNPNVLIFPDKPTYREGETLTLSLYNNGIDTLTTGYGITRRLFMFWVYPFCAPVQQGFTLVAYLIPPRGVFTETISLSGFPSGVYRIEKDGAYT